MFGEGNELAGAWLAAEASDDLRRRFHQRAFDDHGWEEIPVPGHWGSSAAFATSQGPLFYRRPFEAAAPAPGRRSWLVLNGIFYQADVWLDGSYLGDTEGYFAPHALEITDQLAAASEHVLAVEVACPPQSRGHTRRNLTGSFQAWECLSESWNPGGIWAPVRVEETGPVRISSLQMVCPEATPDRAALEVVAQLDASAPTRVIVVTEVSHEGLTVKLHTERHDLAAGNNRLAWRTVIEQPHLWWPHALGSQPLYDVAVSVALEGEVSDGRALRTGLREVRTRDFITTVNGERLFLKGANYGPSSRAPAEAHPAQIEHDVLLAREAHLDLLRVHAHVARPELYDAADRQGLLLWQDMPLLGGYSRVLRQALHQARAAVTLLGHHPSVLLWCGRSEPYPLNRAVGGSARARLIARQALPSWSRTGLDEGIKRTLEKADGSRPVVAHSGVLPHPSWGTDTHLYLGWHQGEATDVAPLMKRLPVLARFVGEFGAQAVPETADFCHPELWPDLDWDRLTTDHCLQRQELERRAPTAGAASFDDWRRASQSYQADLVRRYVETLRRLKYSPAGGFCQYLLADAQPAISWSVLDDQRVPKAGYRALAAACAPVIMVADPLPATFRPGERVAVDVHVVSDLRRPLHLAKARCTLQWPGGERIWRFGGDIPADSCVRVGRLDLTPDIDAAAQGDVRLQLHLDWPDNGGPPVTNSYLSTLASPSRATPRAPSKLGSGEPPPRAASPRPPLLDRSQSSTHVDTGRSPAARRRAGLLAHALAWPAALSRR